MTIRVAINGFGRIGRLVFRRICERPDMQVVAINDLVPLANLAYLLQYDSIHGSFKQQISIDQDALIIEGNKVEVYAEQNPKDLPWSKLDVDFVVESTGLFTTKEAAENHIIAGAKQVVISAPTKSEDVPTFVMGVNNHNYDYTEHKIVSNASCTTNCLAPITKVLLDNFGIEEGLMTTVHAATATQATVDSPSKKDWRAGRCASQNIIPSSTGAAEAVALCLPEVKGKLTGMAFRVPVCDVSVVDLTVKLKTSTSYEAVCLAMKKASENAMKGILSYCKDQVVSSDFIGSRFSSIFDSTAGIALNDKFFKLISWYDNEMAYACRVVDLVEYMFKRNHSEILYELNS